MGHSTAEAVVRAGLTLVPYTFTGRSEAVAVGNVGVCGLPVELITREERQNALNSILKDYPDLVVIDYTLPSAVNGWFCSSAFVLFPFCLYYLILPLLVLLMLLVVLLLLVVVVVVVVLVS